MKTKYFSDAFYTLLSSEQQLVSVTDHPIGHVDPERDIFDFLESRVYDKENVNVLLLLEGDCLHRFIEKVN